MLLDDNIGGEFLELANTCSEIRGTGSACGGGETGSSSSFIAVSLILSKDGLFEPIGIVVVALVLLFDFKIRLPSKVDKGNFLLEPSLDKRLFFGGAAG